MRLRWTPQAVTELEEVDAYLRRELPALSQSTMRTLYDAARSLKIMPLRGRRGVSPARWSCLFSLFHLSSFTGLIEERLKCLVFGTPPATYWCVNLLFNCELAGISVQQLIDILGLHAF